MCILPHRSFTRWSLSTKFAITEKVAQVPELPRDREIKPCLAIKQYKFSSKIDSNGAEFTE